MTTNDPGTRCFACNKPIRGQRHMVVTEDHAQRPYVGPECYNSVKVAKQEGYQPPLGGPRLFALIYAPPCCANEQRDMNGGCINCGSPCW